MIGRGISHAADFAAEKTLLHWKGTFGTFFNAPTRMEYADRMTMSKIGQVIAEKSTVKLLEKYKAIKTIMMLLNPKTTLIRNPIGNAFLNLAEDLKKNTFGVPLDAATTGYRNMLRRNT